MWEADLLLGHPIPVKSSSNDLRTFPKCGNNMGPNLVLNEQKGMTNVVIYVS